MIGSTVEKLLPMVPDAGPPLPLGLKIGWPEIIARNMLRPGLKPIRTFSMRMSAWQGRLLRELPGR